MDNKGSRKVDRKVKIHKRIAVKKQDYIIIGVLLLAAIVYFISMKYKPGQIKVLGNIDTKKPNDNSGVVQPKSEFPLTIGSSGEAVVGLQKALFNKGNTVVKNILQTSSMKNGVFDGKLGPKTLEAYNTYTGKKLSVITMQDWLSVVQ